VENEVKTIIADEADRLARRYRIKDKKRVQAILERTAGGVLGHPIPDGIHGGKTLRRGLTFHPSLHQALLYLPPNEALAIFETADLTRLSGRSFLVSYLAHPTTPFYTLMELADLAEEFVSHLERNSSSLVKIGLPATSFEKSGWFDFRLNHAYFVKLPVCLQANRSPEAQRVAEQDGLAERDANGNLIFNYSWVDKCPLSGTLRWAEDRPILEKRVGPVVSSDGLRFCAYENASLIHGLAVDDAVWLEKHRGEYVQATIKLIQTLVERIRSPSKHGDIWGESLGILKKAFTQREVVSYMLVTNHLRALRVWDYLASLRGWTLEGYSIGGLGGLYELFHVTGHFEKEVRIGAFNKTKSAVIEQFGDVGAIKSYYQVVGKPSHSDLDRVIDILLESHDAEQRFWADFDKRVWAALKREFLAKVRLEAYVESEFAESLSDFGQGQLNGWAAHLTKFGTIAPGGVGLEIGDAVSALSPGQEKDYKRFDYMCRDQVHVLGTRPMKRSNIIDVNGHRVRIGDSLLKLFLRLVVELKKKKGGWVNIHTLEEEGLIGDPLTYQRYSNLRKALEGSLLLKNGQNFIESDGSKSYRISTHPDFITYDKKKLAKQHPDPDINEIAKKLP